MPVYTVKAHKEIVNSIDGVGGLGIGDGAPEIVTGSRDGKTTKKVNVVYSKNVFKAATQRKLRIEINIKFPWVLQGL